MVSTARIQLPTLYMFSLEIIFKKPDCNVSFLFLKFILLKYSWFIILCRVLLQSQAVQLYTDTDIDILFHYGLLQDIGYSSLCYTVGPCCLLSVPHLSAFSIEQEGAQPVGYSISVLSWDGWLNSCLQIIPMTPGQLCGATNPIRSSLLHEGQVLWSTSHVCWGPEQENRYAPDACHTGHACVRLN